MQIDDKTLNQISTGVVSGVSLAGLLALCVSIKKHFGIPNRVKKLEESQNVLFQGQIAQNEALLALLENRCEDENTASIIRAKDFLIKSKNDMQEHITNRATRGEK